jgi:hypothetical protein
MKKEKPLRLYYEGGKMVEIKAPKYTREEKKAVFRGTGKIKKVKLKWGRWK